MKKFPAIVVGAVLILSIGLYSTDFGIGQTYGQPSGITGKFIEGNIPITSPEADIWDEIQPFEITLGPQVVAFPWMHLDPSVRAASVRALHNGTWISFQLTWKDATEDKITVTDKFRDAAAIMLSLGPGAGQCMGAPSAEVTIAHWKADWQNDIETGFTDIPDLYPNYWSDYYVEAVGLPPYDLPALQNSNAKNYVGGFAAGNPLSDTNKITTVETLSAEGFGTLTTHSFQSFIGWGIHDGQEWNLVVSRPLVTGHSDPEWSSNIPTEVTFAIWDGSKGEIGAKKGVSTPLPITLEHVEAEVGSIVTPSSGVSILGVGAIFLLGIAILVSALFLSQRKRAKNEEGEGVNKVE